MRGFEYTAHTAHTCTHTSPKPLWHNSFSQPESVSSDTLSRSHLPCAAHTSGRDEKL
jgi:hypothetical protein